MRSSLFKAFVLIVLFVSCGRIAEKQSIVYDYLDQPVPTTGPAIFAPGIVSLPGRFELGFTISKNGKHMAFGVAHESDSTQTCIYFLHKLSGGWSDPGKRALMNNSNTFFPMFGPNGDHFYYSYLENGAENDLWVGVFKDNFVLAPQPLDSNINSEYREAGHGVTGNGNLYFTSNRDQNYPCCGDIYMARQKEGEMSIVEKIDVLSSNADEESLFVSSNEDFLIIQAWKNEFNAMHDFYISYRNKKGLWSNPTRLNEEINSKQMEHRPFVSPDNKFLFFSRMFEVMNEGEVFFESDIYWVSTDNIFKPYVFNSTIDYKNLEWNEDFVIQLPVDLFNHITQADLSYHVQLKDAKPLPDWIHYDRNTHELSGTWVSKEDLQLEIIASDTFGNEGKYTLHLEINR